jgi:hypothetical protein
VSCSLLSKQHGWRNPRTLYLNPNWTMIIHPIRIADWLLVSPSLSSGRAEPYKSAPCWWFKAGADLDIDVVVEIRLILLLSFNGHNRTKTHFSLDTLKRLLQERSTLSTKHFSTMWELTSCRWVVIMNHDTILPSQQIGRKRRSTASIKHFSTVCEN